VTNSLSNLLSTKGLESVPNLHLSAVIPLNKKAIKKSFSSSQELETTLEKV